MAQIVKLKRSAVAGKLPTTSSLELGEIAINTADGKMYFERSGSEVSVQSILTTNTTTPITGSLNISGSGYTLAVTGSVNTAGGGRVYEQGNSVMDHGTAMAIVFGG